MGLLFKLFKPFCKEGNAYVCLDVGNLWFEYLSFVRRHACVQRAADFLNPGPRSLSPTLQRLSALT